MYSWQLICQVPFFHVVLSFSGNVLQSVLVPSGGQVTKCHLGDSHVGSGITLAKDMMAMPLPRPKSSAAALAKTMQVNSV